MPKTQFTYPDDQPLIIEVREFNAPRELVWRAQTDPAMLAQWWGPRYLRNEIVEMDVRPGGRWRINQHAPDGQVHPFKGEYLEVEPPHTLVFTFAYADYPAAPLRITLEDLGDGRTRLTSVMDMATMQAREGLRASDMEVGARESYERLDVLLGQARLVIERRLAAPRGLVWKAFTEASRLAQWWGPAGFEWIDGQLDLRPDGRFLFGMKTPDGSEMWARFRYVQVQAPERLSFAVAFTDRHGQPRQADFDPNFPLEYMNIVTLREEGWETVLTHEAWAVSEEPAQLAAFAALEADMQRGFGGTYDQLEAYLDRQQETV